VELEGVLGGVLCCSENAQGLEEDDGAGGVVDGAGAAFVDAAASGVEVGADDDEGGGRGGAGDAHDDGGLVELGVRELGDGDGGVGGCDGLDGVEEPGCGLGAVFGFVVAGVEAGGLVSSWKWEGGGETYSVRVLAQLWGCVVESWAIRGSASALWEMLVG